MLLFERSLTMINEHRTVPLPLDSFFSEANTTNRPRMIFSEANTTMIFKVFTVRFMLTIETTKQNLE